MSLGPTRDTDDVSREGLWAVSITSGSTSVQRGTFVCSYTSHITCIPKFMVLRLIYGHNFVNACLSRAGENLGVRDTERGRKIMIEA
jgi:hypothetical protein